MGVWRQGMAAQLTLTSDDGDDEGFTVTEATTDHGTCKMDGNQLTYTPPPDYVGLAIVKYTANSGKKQHEKKELRVNVVAAPVSKAPVNVVAPAVAAVAPVVAAKVAAVASAGGSKGGGKGSVSVSTSSRSAAITKGGKGDLPPLNYEAIQARVLPLPVVEGSTVAN